MSQLYLFNKTPRKGEYVFRKGDKAKYFYVLYMGECRTYGKDGKNILKVGIGDIIGLESLEKDNTYKYDVQVSFEFTFLFKLEIKVFHGCELVVSEYLKDIAAKQLEVIYEMQRRKKIMQFKRSIENSMENELLAKLQQKKQRKKKSSFSRMDLLSLPKLSQINASIDSRDKKLITSRTIKSRKEKQVKVSTALKSTFSNFTVGARKIKKSRKWKPVSSIAETLDSWDSFKRTDKFNSGRFELPLFTKIQDYPE